MDGDYSHTPVTVAGKSAVVIGGTSGIGRAIALGFATEGADVIASSRDEGRVEDVTEEVRDRGATTAAVTCDVRNRADIERLCETATDRLGGVDVLVNSAGTVARHSIRDISEADWERDIDVCLDGVYRTIQIFADEMDTGSIVTISSMSAWQLREDRPSYCAAKSGVNGLTRAAAADLGPDIRVNAIAPGFIQTPITQGAYDEGTEKRAFIDQRAPAARVGQPEEIVGATIYLASDAASYTTGEVLTVDGGYHNSAL